MEKKWPVLAQVLIGFGCIGGMQGIGQLLFSKDIISGILGGASLVIWLNLYKFKSWALLALTILYVASILFGIFSLFQGAPLAFVIIAIVFQGLTIWYFNSPSVRTLMQ